jgi:hypothetical protein
MSREGRDEAKRVKGGFAMVYFDSTGADLGCSQESDNLAHRHKKHIASGMIENSFFCENSRPDPSASSIEISSDNPL